MLEKDKFTTDSNLDLRLRQQGIDTNSVPEIAQRINGNSQPAATGEVAERRKGKNSQLLIMTGDEGPSCIDRSLPRDRTAPIVLEPPNDFIAAHNIS